MAESFGPVVPGAPGVLWNAEHRYPLPSTPPPLRDFCGWLKCQRPHHVNELGRLVTSTAFPLFVKTSLDSELTQAEEQRNAAFRAVGVTVVEEAPVRYRRFAGDRRGGHALGKGRYHTVCTDGSGRDHGTLANEFNSYCNAHEVGFALVADHADTPSPRHAVSVVLRDLAEAPSSALTKAKARGLIPDHVDAAHVEIPYDVSETRIPGVLDLRYPDARKWLCDEFGFGKAGVLVLPNGAPTREITFLDMLPSLMARDNGGDDLTNVIGAYLRLIGVSALVFPSARSNVFVDFRDGTLNDFGGWNLVDYRDAETEPRATMLLWDVEWPWFRDSSKMRHLDRTTVIRAPEDDSMWRGSFRVEGNTEHHLLFLHVQLCLRLWGAGHPESVPWYRWHVTRPSSASEPFPLEATCQDCGHVLAPVEDVFAFHMLPRQCPGCGFAKIHVG